MIKEILIDTKPEQTRIAILEDGELAELHIESSEKRKLVGNIYRGKIERVLPGMQCAFVDIGIGKNAYLSVDEVIPPKKHLFDEKNTCPVKIENVVKQGQEITVQVIKEEIGTKGPKVTTNITLAGNLTVLYPFSTGVGISKKIDSQEERERLKNIAEELCPEGMGIVIRTAAEGAEASPIENDLQNLLRTWELVKKNEEKGRVPRCIYQEPDLVQKLVQGGVNSNIKRIVLNDRKEYENLIKFLDDTAPEMKTRVEFFCKDYELFKFYGIDNAIKEALSRKVWLKSGGYLIFDYTEALTVIDVNTGKFVGKNNQDETIFKTNCEAALTIARQIRLRDISGIILIDFIDMKDNYHKETVLSILKEACKKDGTQVVVVGMTNLGLVELTRKKIRNSLSQVLTRPCPNCGGSGRVLDD